MDMNALIVIPTYNEAENITRLIETIFSLLKRDDFSILVVDDHSPDGTAELVNLLIKRYQRLFLLKRPGKGGLAAAYLAGFQWGLERNFDAFLEMDADFSHRPEYLPTMFDEIDRHEVVIGSRNIIGGGVENWPPLRRLISKGGSLYARLILNCPIADLTGGFNFWRKSAFEKINLSKIFSQGYSFQIEMKYKAYLTGCDIHEFPIIFPDRKAGVSKMSSTIFLEAMLNIVKLRFYGIDEN